MFKVKATVSVRMPSGRFPRGSYAKVLTETRADVVRDVEQAFERKADPVTGRAWPARKDPLLSHPLLQRTGKMRAGAVAAAGRAAVNGNTLIVRMRQPAYAKYHHAGTRLMAKRRFVGVSSATRRKLARRLRAEGVRVIRSPRGR